MNELKNELYFLKEMSKKLKSSISELYFYEKEIIKVEELIKNKLFELNILKEINKFNFSY